MCWPFHSILIRQIVGLNANVIWFRVLNKANRLDFTEPLQESLADAVHPIHHTAVTGQNDGERKIAIKHQARMVNYLTAGQFLRLSACPIRFVEFSDCRQGNAFAGKRAGELDETVHIPRAQPRRRIPKMILSPHRTPVLRLNYQGCNYSFECQGFRSRFEVSVLLPLFGTGQEIAKVNRLWVEPVQVCRGYLLAGE
jgi:hypothetical protein